MRSGERARDTGAGQGSAQGVLRAVSVAPGSQTGRLRCVRASAVMTLCGMSCAVVAVARAVSRRAIGHRSAVSPGGVRRGCGRVRGAVWSGADARVMHGPPRVYTRAYSERLGPVSQLVLIVQTFTRHQFCAGIPKVHRTSTYL